MRLYWSTFVSRLWVFLNPQSRRRAAVDENIQTLMLTICYRAAVIKTYTPGPIHHSVRMSQTRNAAKKSLPTLVVIATAGIVVGTGGLVTWRSRRSKARIADVNNDDPSSTTNTLKRTGPMVAVYLDNNSVEKLNREFPGITRGRLRKVVVQYNPSDEERRMYEPYFGGLATVKLTGEAFSSNRRALVASVSQADSPIEPKSLSCAVDATPGDAGGGPLGSAALIEQIKRAGAEKEVSWKGMLPQLTAHDREFASEEGGYDRLDETLTLSGSLCRADWVEGISGRCRTQTEGGLPRTDGWTPQGCILCNTLEASPCRDIYKRFDSISERISKLKPQDEPADEKRSGDASSEYSAGGEAKTVEGPDEKESSALKPNDETPVSLKGGKQTGDSGEPADGEEARVDLEEGEKLRMQELEKLETEREGIAMEMLLCSDQYAVWLDSNADDGFTSDMMNEDDDGTRIEESSGTDVGGGDDRESGKRKEKE